MRRLLAVGAPVLMMCVGGTAAAQVPADTGRVHVVRPGDTLWDLARQYLADPFLWPRIHDANQAQVEDPHWIFPRERILIPGLAGLPGGQTAAADASAIVQLQPEHPPRTVFFPSAVMEGRTLIGPDAVPSAAVARGEFYSAGVLVPREQVRALGVIAEVLSPTVLPVSGSVHPLPYEKVFMVVAEPGAVRRGDHVQFVREGRAVRPFGRIFESTGIGQIVEIDGATATVEIQEHFDAVAVGNLAVALTEYEIPVGVRPQPGPVGLTGNLIAFQFPQPVYSVRDFGFIDLGSDSGITEGDILEAVLPPEVEEWGLRPEIVVAMLQVVRVTDRTSAVQVVSVEHPAIEPGLLVRVVAKMPAP